MSINGSDSYSISSSNYKQFQLLTNNQNNNNSNNQNNNQNDKQNIKQNEQSQQQITFQKYISPSINAQQQQQVTTFSSYSSPQPVFKLRPSISPEPQMNRNYSSTNNNQLYNRYLLENRDRYSSNTTQPGSSAASTRNHRSPSPHNVHFLTPQRAEIMSSACQIGVLSPSTPPISRQRRHSKLNLRIAGTMSMDHGDGPPIYAGGNISNNSSLNASSANVSNSSPSNTSPSTGLSSTIKAATKERYRIVIMGSSAVGKTAIVEQFLYGSFPETHCATVEELHKGEYEIAGGSAIPLEILDTSGSFEFPAMRRLAISTGDAFALIYSIDSQSSFDEVKSMREMIIQVKGTDPAPPIVVVGNKCDLEERRSVKIEVAECECIDWDVGFVECSAKNNRNIINIFSCMLIQARLKGTLNVAQLASQTSSHGRHIGYRDSTELVRSRRRSSLPISELFARFPRSSPSDSRAASAASNHNNSASFRKRNSCTPS